MKFYALTYNANLPTKQQVNIPTNTDYKIGVKVVRNGELLDLDPADVTLGSLSADADKTNGYVTFTTAAGDDSSYTQKSLVVDSESVDLRFDLVENIFKSQQGELDILGDTSNFYTKAETDTMLSAKADEADVFTREQLSAMFAPLKDAGTGTAKKASEILSSDIVASLFNVAVELYGEPPIPPTSVKYTAASGLPDWEGDIVGELKSNSIPDKSNAEAVDIGGRVTSIGSAAFSWCQNLTSVTIPDSVSSIGDYGFENCIKLSSVTIPGNVTSIGEQAFSSCTKITSIAIPGNVTSIGEQAFSYCSTLSAVEFNGNAPTVGTDAFTGVASGCKALVSSTATGFPAAGETWNGLVVEYK